MIEYEHTWHPKLSIPITCVRLY